MSSENEAPSIGSTVSYPESGIWGSVISVDPESGEMILQSDPRDPGVRVRVNYITRRIVTVPKSKAKADAPKPPEVG